MNKDIKDNENEWSYHPIIIFTGMIVMYTVSSSIATLLNL